MAILIPASCAELTKFENIGLTCDASSDALPVNLPPVWISITVWSKSSARKLMPSSFRFQNGTSSMAR